MNSKTRPHFEKNVDKTKYENALITMKLKQGRNKLITRLNSFDNIGIFSALQKIKLSDQKAANY